MLSREEAVQRLRGAIGSHRSRFGDGAANHIIEALDTLAELSRPDHQGGDAPCSPPNPTTCNDAPSPEQPGGGALGPERRKD